MIIKSLTRCCVHAHVCVYVCLCVCVPFLFLSICPSLSYKIIDIGSPHLICLQQKSGIPELSQERKSYYNMEKEWENRVLKNKV